MVRVGKLQTFWLQKSRPSAVRGMTLCYQPAGPTLRVHGQHTFTDQMVTLRRVKVGRVRASSRGYTHWEVVDENKML